jgi:signal transduction histidine kinase/ActR/RegA family two-component response regulator
MLGLERSAMEAAVARELGVPLDAQEREAVALEQLRMVLSHTRFGTLAATAFALFAAWLLTDMVDPALVQIWVGVKLAVAAARIALAQVWARRGQSPASGWRTATYALLALDGIVWGAAGLHLVEGTVALASLIAAVMASVTCVATFGLQIRTLATLAYVGPILALTGFGLALRGDETGLVGGIGMLTLLVLQMLTALAAQRRFVTGVLLRLQAERLAREKEAALQLAQAQSAVKAQFLAKISHELRTPLHGILGLARLVHLELQDPALQRRVELIEASGMHLLALINDLLDLSRIEAGRFETRSESFDLVDQCEQLADVFAVRAQDKGLMMTVDMALPRPTWVLGDAARFRQVLHNLLGNAVKFTERGGIRLRVGRGPAADEIRVEVIDSGPGIAEDELERVFQAFQQSDHAPLHPTEGAGLGLTIAREIAQSMGGDIAASSQLGRGSRFVFTARLPAAAAPDRSSPAADGGALPRRVLVAEDDEVNALIVGAYLEALGVAFERVTDGKQAVGHALRETGRPELVLMDWRMPTMDGLAATREIRTQERLLGLPRVPVIALTATTSSTEREQCIAAGMDEVLAKPFTQEQLAAALARWAGRPGVRPEVQ